MFVALDKIPKLQLSSHALNCCGQNYNFELNLDLRLAYKTCNGQKSDIVHIHYENSNGTVSGASKYSFIAY